MTNKTMYGKIIYSIPTGLLPATTLASSCYSYMFNNCTSLSIGSTYTLSATTLEESCYSNMFNGCTNLTTTPSLNATTLVKGCYEKMFYGCSKLESIRCKATNIDAEDCTKEWTSGVSANGTFYKSSNVDENFWPQGENGIPEGWSISTP